jgi:hypothetical protein
MRGSGSETVKREDPARDAFLRLMNEALSLEPMAVV